MSKGEPDRLEHQAMMSAMSGQQHLPGSAHAGSAHASTSSAPLPASTAPPAALPALNKRVASPSSTLDASDAEAKRRKLALSCSECKRR